MKIHSLLIACPLTQRNYRLDLQNFHYEVRRQRSQYFTHVINRSCNILKDAYSFQLIK